MQRCQPDSGQAPECASPDNAKTLPFKGKFYILVEPKIYLTSTVNKISSWLTMYSSIAKALIEVPFYETRGCKQNVS